MPGHEIVHAVALALTVLAAGGTVVGASRRGGRRRWAEAAASGVMVAAMADMAARAPGLHSFAWAGALYVAALGVLVPDGVARRTLVPDAVLVPDGVATVGPSARLAIRADAACVWSAVAMALVLVATGLAALAPPGATVADATVAAHVHAHAHGGGGLVGAWVPVALAAVTGSLVIGLRVVVRQWRTQRAGALATAAMAAGTALMATTLVA
ncbi:MAG TPA: hypothetical protein DHV14_07065 [Micrococcales bacterium]|uniref:hypothetical protein n=1 Tax=Miniimonas arenae TaxID=676201 RepID=UPI000EE9A6AA|nr:hypothetical protein [Miniimonas arenae]HCX84880.1 hypothetical protein [Micrococcales bacterium]